MHVVAICLGLAVMGQPLSVTVGDVELQWRNGTIVGFRVGGRQWLRDPGADLGAIVRHGPGDLTFGPGAIAERDGATVLTWPAGEGQGHASIRVRPGGPGEVVLEGDAQAPDGHLTGIRWALASLPPAWKILVPGNSGLALDGTGPTEWSGQWPMAWEVQFVVAQGPGRGMWVWAEDARGRFKSLRVERKSDGWRLMFTAENFAPWDEKTRCDLGRWHVATFEGDWRVPARQYLEWAHKSRGLQPLAEHGPAWVQDIRCVVICSADQEFLQALARHVQPSQTLLYVPGWRRDGYDRNYPDYTAIEGFEDFVQAAHELGFRVMVHVNYFGCDPKNPEYARFEKYQVVDPYGGERQWWVWPFPPEEPDIKFAYINPAVKEWRDLLVERFRELVARYKVDALHLDQTLCIFNDRNGLYDGMSMIDGNLALHRALREALPEVALSGEGLNEVTCQYESFAQRHAWGLDFLQRTYSVPMLRMAHPISSYVLLPHTKIYGYLGMSAPAEGDVYAAWRENYNRWGVLPTLAHISTGDLKKPDGWLAFALAEAAWFQRERVEPDLEGPWPEDCLFPYRLGNGGRAWWRTDGGMVLETVEPRREVVRIIHGANHVRSEGGVPGWRAQNTGEIFGLDPQVWYPVVPDVGPPEGLRVSGLGEGALIKRVNASDDLAAAVIEPLAHVPYRFWELLGTARCGWRGYGGGELEVEGPLNDEDSGASFAAHVWSPWAIFAHPPWKLRPQIEPPPGLPGNSGITWGRFDVTIPDKPSRLLAAAVLGKGATLPGRSDGVVFRMRVEAPGKTLRVEKLIKSEVPEPLELDLEPLRGQKAQVWLEVEPNAHPSFDWAIWQDPRIETKETARARLTLTDETVWPLALVGDELVDLDAREVDAVVNMPGGVFLLRARPREIPADAELWELPFEVSFCDKTGMALNEPAFACGIVKETTVGGVTRPGIFAHPPNQGRTYVDFLVHLPQTPLVFKSWVGLGDGSRSTGCEFVVQVNGKEVASKTLLPEDGWQELSADLSPWAGKPIVLSLVTDSYGRFDCDWAAWGEPRLEAAKG